MEARGPDANERLCTGGRRMETGKGEWWEQGPAVAQGEGRTWVRELLWVFRDSWRHVVALPLYFVAGWWLAAFVMLIALELADIGAGLKWGVLPDLGLRYKESEVVFQWIGWASLAFGMLGAVNVSLIQPRLVQVRRGMALMLVGMPGVLMLMTAMKSLIVESVFHPVLAALFLTLAGAAFWFVAGEFVRGLSRGVGTAPRIAVSGLLCAVTVLGIVCVDDHYPPGARFGYAWRLLTEDRLEAEFYWLQVKERDLEDIEAVYALIKQHLPRLEEALALVQKGHPREEKVKELLMRFDPEGREAPGLEGKALDGSAFSLEAERGRFVLVDFWATWCGPCREEIPHLLKAAGLLKPHGVRMVGVSMDKKEEQLRAFLKEEGVTWTNLLADKSLYQQVRNEWGVRRIPSNFLIGPDGRIVAAHIRGPETGKRILKAVRAWNVRQAWGKSAS